MKNWKTTLGGLLSAVGAVLQVSENIYIKNAGVILVAVGLMLLGGSAADSKKG